MKRITQLRKSYIGKGKDASGSFNSLLMVFITGIIEPSRSIGRIISSDKSFTPITNKNSIEWISWRLPFSRSGS